MEGKDQMESVKPEESKSLEGFLDGQLVEELGKRLGSNPKVDPALLEKLQTLTAALQQKAEVSKLPPVETEKTTEAGAGAPAEEAKPEVSAESEGKKWARIIREKGVGILDGKFRRDWTYLQEDGKPGRIAENPGGGFTVAGLFGAGEKDRREMNLVQGIDIDNNVDILLAGSKIVNHEYNMGIPSRANFLQVMQLGARKDRFSNGGIIRYLSWLDPRSGPDSRSITPFGFTFVLPQKEMQEFSDTLVENVGLIEDVFQNVYPGLTGEKGAKRMMVEKLIVMSSEDNISDWMKGKGVAKVSFSRPVGETPWTK